MRTLILLVTGLLSVPALAETENVPAQAKTGTEYNSQFRLGIGRSFLYNDPSRSYSRTEEAWHYGWHVSADYTHNRYLGVRVNFYAMDGADDVTGYGNEVQLLAGYGLDGNGFRIYTGPIWFREQRKDADAIRDKSEVFSDFGWNIGAGYQWQRWSFDVSTSVRNNSDYVDYYEDKNVALNKDDVWALAIFSTLSYQL